MNDEAPSGYHREWVVDEGWKMADLERVCRMNGCSNPAVAALSRRHGRDGSRWWYYCADHLYGREIRDGVVKSWRLVKRPGGALVIGDVLFAIGLGMVLVALLGDWKTVKKLKNIGTDTDTLGAGK